MSFDPNMFEGMTEEEIELFEEEAMLAFLREMMAEETRKGVIRVPNLDRLREMKTATQALRKITTDYNLNIKVEVGVTPISHSGCVTLICPFGFSTDDVPEFANTIAAATNVEFVIEDGCVQINILYQGIFHSEQIRN